MLCIYISCYPFSQFSTLIFILVPSFVSPSLLPDKQPAPICFPCWSQFCYLHTHTKYFWYYNYLYNLGSAMYLCASFPGISQPWKILLPFSYLLSLAISYIFSLATCEVQPVLMALSSVSFSLSYPAYQAISHVWKFFSEHLVQLAEPQTSAQPLV